MELEPKAPGEVRNFSFNWAEFLGTDTIASSIVQVSGVTLVSSPTAHDATTVAVKVSGGTNSTTARITNTITSAAGLVETEVALLQITDASEPISVAEARSQVNIIDAADTTYDVFLASLIPSARATVENISRYFWVSASRSETFSAWGDDHDRFHGRHDRSQFLRIYRRPIASVDTITYTDQDGNDATYDAFVAPLSRFPLLIYPAIDGSFPALGRGGVIKVDYTSGALDIASEEYLMGKRAMLLLIGHWFANREGVIADLRAAVADVPWAVTELLNNLSPISAY